MLSRPSEHEYAPYFARYIALVPETEILSVLKHQIADIERAAGAVAAGQEQFRYGPDKWSVRQVFGHLTDAERVFGYRSFCISRGEQAPLPAFDENAYVEKSAYDGCALSELMTELVLTRQANLAFLSRLTDDEWMRTGTASSKPVS
ncbi:MAG TPA: DinB family protein, partial [Bacteroidota bacterium]|nr:DinB family protein [Bacteroidota bacterium]